MNIALLGNSGVGKTCIIQQYCKNEFRDLTAMTCCIDFAKKQFEDFLLCVFDTAGSERYRGLATSYLKNQHAVIIVYDVTDPKSKRDVINWKNIAESFSPSIPIIIIGNKVDLISNEELKSMQQEQNAYIFNKTFFTSALLNQGLDDAFNYIINQAKNKLNQSVICSPKKFKKNIKNDENQKKNANNCKC
nr:Rab-family small GTPase RabX22 [Tetrahymena thermophila]